MNDFPSSHLFLSVTIDESLETNNSPLCTRLGGLYNPAFPLRECMNKKKLKPWLTVAKLIIAALLLTWVFSQVHWHDYVIPKADQKKTCAVLGGPDAQGNLTIRTGLFQGRTLTANALDFVPVPGKANPYDVRRLGFVSAIKGLRLPLLAGAFGAWLVSWLVISVRWWLLLRIQEIRIKVWEAVRLTFLGQFFNNVLPSTVGGDLVKAYYVSKHTHLKAATLVSVFVDRVLGLTELSLLAAVMVGVVLGLGGLARLEDKPIRYAALAAVIVMGMVIFTLTFLLSAGFRRLFHLQKVYQRLPIAHHIVAAGDAANLYRRRIWSLVKVVLMTFGAHMMWIAAVGMIGFSLSLPTPWYTYFLYIPLIYIIGAIPVSFGGVGLIEGLYVGFFASVDPSMILALALLARLVQVFWSLPGVIVAVTGPKLPKAAAMEAELELEEKA